MAFIDEVNRLSKQFADTIAHLNSKNYLNTEAATKRSLVDPFIQLLGYDDPTEVVPEFPADVRTKRGEKVDYALFHNDKPAILIECKQHGSDLNHDDVVSQLRSYFTGSTDARFGILTNGIAYRFFSDLDQRNVMDAKPFFEFNMLHFTKSQVEDLKQFTKSNFRENKLVERANSLKYIKLKYITAIKNRLVQERSAPSDAFVRFIMRPIYSGSLTPKVMEEFRPMVRDAFNEFVDERIAARLKSDLDQPEPPDPPPPNGWTPLSQIDDVTGQKPTAIKINNGEPQPVKHWAYVLRKIGEWLVKAGHLKAEDFPSSGVRGLPFISSAPYTDKRSFINPKQISGGIYLDTSHGSTQIILYSKRLLTHYSIEHEAVEIQFE